MDLKKVAASLTDAANELRTEKNPNAAIGMAITETVSALRIVKAQSEIPAAAPAPADNTAKK